MENVKTLCSQHKVDKVGLSFVSNHKDVKDLRHFLGSAGQDVQIVSKIDSLEGI